MSKPDDYYIIHCKPEKTIHGVLFLGDKKELIEKGLKQFHQSEEYRALLEWVLIEHEKMIKEGLREQIKKLKQFEEVKPEYYNAIKDVLDFLE